MWPIVRRNGSVRCTAPIWAAAMQMLRGMRDSKWLSLVDLRTVNATVVTTSDPLVNQDIANWNDQIAFLGQNLISIFSASQVIKAPGAYIAPGGIDSHVYLNQDNSLTGDFETGARLAIAGGYHERDREKACCDNGFNLILTALAAKVVDEEFPILMHEGISSVKLSDRELLDVKTRLCTTMPYHVQILLEDEATDRIIFVAGFIEVPILIMRMSSAIAASHAAEHPMDLDALWQGLSGGTFAIFLSDYASDSNYHPRGKKAALSAAEAPLVCKILNRLPGVETRMTMLMSEGAELTSMNHAKLYGMRGQKGTIASGMIQTWSSVSPILPFTITNSALHNDINYTRFEGIAVRNWPRFTILRGTIVWDRDGKGVGGRVGYENFIRKGESTMSRPRQEFENQFS
ncbi:Metallo-dependent hydrolase [Lepidopterella palustris CBS 459.81]|uniref:Metallo-dependent hydrolase n=1 Tax=Lepidopterella palustris CBS 459.81 TaxID=1314670 RepID=A0A8E2E7Z7_9PEZI|nr:Metallo-dependent hydrolase [Lepidopterella palustris CBS 459.81]